MGRGGSFGVMRFDGGTSIRVPRAVSRVLPWTEDRHYDCCNLPHRACTAVCPWSFTMKTRKAIGHRRNRPLGLEQLESRVVLDGNVNAFMSGGSLHINGGSA